MTETASHSGDATPPVDAANLKDFPNWLSPVLVKELRQGMRTHIFTIAFIALQLVMFVLSFFASLTAGMGDAGQEFSGIFWFILSTLLIVVMPLRGFSALSGEIRGGTMEPLYLTRLSAWRITFGKWLAIVVQSALITVTVLPYVVVRYWFGGVDIANELMALSGVFLASALLTALFVGFSAHTSFVIRIVVAGGTYLFMYGFGMNVMARLMMRGVYGGGPSMYSPLTDWGTISAIVFVLVFFTYFLLDMGATMIAPLSSNHSTRKRLAGLATAMALMLSNLIWDEFFLIVLATLVLAVVCLDALNERPTTVFSVYRPFFRRGPPGELAAFFLAPGWPHGVLFSGIAGITLVGLASVDQDLDSTQVAILVAILGCIMFPVPILAVVRRGRWTFAAYLIVQIAVLGFLLMLGIIGSAGSSGKEALFLAAPYPLSWIVLMEGHTVSEADGTVSIWFTSLIILFLSFMLALRHFRRVRERYAAEESRNQPE